jgi:hypothetical protein
VDDVVGLARRGDHEDLQVRALVEELVADVVAVDLGQVAVQDEDVVADHARLLERHGAVARDVHGHALAAQAAGHRLGELGVVFGEEHAHRGPDR